MRVLMLAVVFALGGCTFTLVGDAEKSEGDIAHNETINSTALKSEKFVNLCPGEGASISEIRVETNALYLLASIFSLGTYVPQNVTWWCGGESTECAEGDESEDCKAYVREDDER